MNITIMIMMVRFWTLQKDQNIHHNCPYTIQPEKNGTNFLESGVHVNLPIHHPIRLFNILVSTLYMVFVPFVYFVIFR